MTTRGRKKKQDPSQTNDSTAMAVANVTQVVQQYAQASEQAMNQVLESMSNLGIASDVSDAFRQAGEATAKAVQAEVEALESMMSVNQDMQAGIAYEASPEQTPENPQTGAEDAIQQAINNMNRNI